ncbi:MAG: 50S ribosomal protein L22 [Candidatus Woesearchaeota archaeon]
MAYGYATQTTEERVARAQGVNLPISFKHAVEIGNYVRGNTLNRAKKKLEDAISKSVPVPFKRFTDGVGHKRGDGAAGRYPVKACTELLKLLNSVEANALFKGFSSKNLVLSAFVVKKAPAVWRHGRQSRRQMKRAHVEVIVTEVMPSATSKKAPVKEIQTVSKSAQESLKEDKSPSSDIVAPKKAVSQESTSDAKKEVDASSKPTSSSVSKETEKKVDSDKKNTETSSDSTEKKPIPKTAETTEASQDTSSKK